LFLRVLRASVVNVFRQIHIRIPKTGMPGAPILSHPLGKGGTNGASTVNSAEPAAGVPAERRLCAR
jgi:hypothetical protein